MAKTRRYLDTTETVVTQGQLHALLMVARAVYCLRVGEDIGHEIEGLRQAVHLASAYEWLNRFFADGGTLERAQ